MYSQNVEMYLDVEPVRYTFHAGQVLAMIRDAACLVHSFFGGFLHWPKLHSEPIKDVWSVSKWAWWFEHQYQLSKCTVVSRQWRTFLRD